jgi:hypothetical protein
MLLALLPVALAQPVTAVPPGAAAVTVFVCPRADGCTPEWRALAAYMRAVSLPVLDFDSVAAASGGGRDALDRFEAAMAPLRAGVPASGTTPAPAKGSHKKAGPDGDALAALRALPFTVPAADLFLAQLQAGARLFPSAEADRALAAAASVSGRRVYDLPPLPPDVLARYLDLATAPAVPPGELVVVPDIASARVYVDGARFEGGAVSAGWHRVSVERPGRLTAWAASVEVASGRTSRVEASVAADDSAVDLEAAVLAARTGSPPPAEVTRVLQGWARANGLDQVRFVELLPPARSGGAATGTAATGTAATGTAATGTAGASAHGGPEVPEEHLEDEDPTKPGWDVATVYLDVAAGRFGPHGPGPAALLVAADPDRFRLGLSLGYLHGQEFVDTDGFPAHDHVTVEIAGQVRIARSLSLDVRAGLAHAAQIYYLDADWQDRNVYPVSAGLHLGQHGPYAVASALAIVPYALGGELRVGWDLAPSASWRLAPELRAGVTDRGWLAGAAVVMTRRR